ncbi:hypothetical protein [Sphingomonas sp. 10B4]|nr:hypothetical protein [Sphingomonas sp. 10B4]MDY7523668.1 hypothetical protein [Sphingomonas sp. 10B4]MEB0283685.1 hypothetical protein [Sphingomonas sp. 10B4]
MFRLHRDVWHRPLARNLAISADPGSLGIYPSDWRETVVRLN